MLAEFGIDEFPRAGDGVELTVMFGSGIKLDKALLAKVKRYADLAGYSSVEEFITHALEKELAKLEERIRRGDQEEAEGAWLHLLSARTWPS